MHSRDSRLRASILTLVCAKCTRSQQFGVANGPGGVKETSEDIARAGWIQRGTGAKAVTICPRCPQTSTELAMRVLANAPFNDDGDEDEPDTILGGRKVTSA